MWPDTRANQDSQRARMDEQKGFFDTESLNVMCGNVPPGAIGKGNGGGASCISCCVSSSLHSLTNSPEIFLSLQRMRCALVDWLF